MILRNVRRTVELQLAAPLDAQPSAAGASRPVDPVLAATVVRSVIHAAMPWLVVALLVLLFLRYCSWHRRR